MKTTITDNLIFPVMGRSFGTDGVSNFYNEFWLSYTGKALEQEIANGWTENVFQEDLQAFWDIFRDAFNSKKPYKALFRLKRKDGEYRWILENGQAEFYANEFRGYVSYCVDIHDQKLKEAELVNGQRNLKDFIENSNIGLHWVNGEGIIIWANQAELDLLGYTREEYIGQPISKFHADADKINDILTRLNCNEKLHNYEAPLRCKDGSIKYVLISSSVLWEDGKFTHTRCLTRDITDRKLAEEELIHKHNELLKINNDLDNFIYTASHDLKSPVANIEGLINTLSEMINKENSSKDELNSILQMMKLSIDRFSKTIYDLTTITKIQKDTEEEPVEKVNMLELIEDIKLLNGDLMANSGARIFIDCENCMEIKFSRKNLKSILYNLITNAIKYRSPERIPEVHIFTEKKDNVIILNIKDNGLGLDENKQKKLFSMFKRFHDHVEGTGIGLYLVKRIITNAGGRVEVESQPEVGSTFKVYFKESV
jgi:PAS domain S-box-containing protein